MLGTNRRNGCKNTLFLIDYQMFSTTDKVNPENVVIERRFTKIKRRNNFFFRRFIPAERRSAKMFL